MKINIRPFRRTSRLEKLLDAARDVRLPSAVSEVRAPRGIRTGVTAVGAATAASAVISALRRRGDVARDDQ